MKSLLHRRAAAGHLTHVTSVNPLHKLRDAFRRVGKSPCLVDVVLFLGECEAMAPREARSEVPPGRELGVGARHDGRNSALAIRGAHVLLLPPLVELCCQHHDSRW